MIAKVKNFLTEISVELKKVAWPTRNELFGSTVVVIIGIAITAVYLWICDSIFSTGIHLVIK